MREQCNIILFNVKIYKIVQSSNIEPMLHRHQYDRLIPVRNAKERIREIFHSADKKTETETNYTRILSTQSSKYLKFTTQSIETHQNLTDFLLKSLPKKYNNLKVSETRKSVRVLDAPDVVNNFYYNPLDWSQKNTIGIALAESAYLLGTGKQIVQLQRCSQIPITCLKFYNNDILLLGQSTGRIQVFDNQRNKKIRQINAHYSRVGCIQYTSSSEVFVSGSKDKIIKLNDLRLRNTTVSIFEKHKGQICGLSTLKNYLASGGNDNKVIIWDLRKNLPLNQLKQHKSAVKALAWCPWKSCLLAAGGGMNDKRIMLWNGDKNLIQSNIQTQSQVIALQWKQSTKQLISGHYTGQNSHCLVWSGQNVQVKLKGHSGRLLGMKLNKKNQDQLCTIASDETLRFWDIKRSPSSYKIKNFMPKQQNNLYQNFR